MKVMDTPMPSARPLRRIIPIAAFAAVMMLGVLDTLTGPYISFADFYILIVALAAWWSGRATAYSLAVFSTAIEGYSNLMAGREDPHWAVTAWNIVAELLVFVLVAELIVRIHALLLQERRMARSDLLTGIANRRQFEEAALAEIERLKRYRHPFTVALMDLDRFKEVNDTRGHKEGDQVLRKVADVLRSQSRTTDIPARLGGDEFAVLFPETDEKGARQMVPELHRRLGRAMKDRDWPVTFSIGAVTFHKPPRDAGEMLVQPDRLMYQVKKAGRNGVAYGCHR